MHKEHRWCIAHGCRRRAHGCIKHGCVAQGAPEGWAVRTGVYLETCVYLEYLKLYLKLY